MSESFDAADGPMRCEHHGLNPSPYKEQVELVKVLRAEIEKLEDLIKDWIWQK